MESLNDHPLWVACLKEMVKKIKKYGDFKVHKNRIVTSARKFVENGPVKLFWTFFFIYLNYKMGVSQEKLIDMYSKRVKNAKI